MKFATHVLVFNQDKWILKNLANSYPHVDRIYVSYSKIPGVYNRKAREKYTNEFNLDIIKNSPYYDKVTIIEGKGDFDEEQRNACLVQAKKDGMDYLLVHDADEFYTHADFQKILTEIKEDPDYDYYTTPWISFGKSFKYCVEVEGLPAPIAGYPEVALNLKHDSVKFRRCRAPKTGTHKLLTPICHHASFVLDDLEVKRKIETGGHAHQVKKNGYKEKWLDWSLETENIHPVTPGAWKRAILYTGKLPEVLL